MNLQDACCFVNPLCGFSLPLFCNYLQDGVYANDESQRRAQAGLRPLSGTAAGCMGFVWVHADSFLRCVASPFHSVLLQVPLSAHLQRRQHHSRGSGALPVNQKVVPASAFLRNAAEVENGQSAEAKSPLPQGTRHGARANVAIDDNDVLVRSRTVAGTRTMCQVIVSDQCSKSCYNTIRSICG